MLPTRSQFSLPWHAGRLGRIAWVLTFPLASLLVGCGGSSDDPDGGSDSSRPTTPAPEATAPCEDLMRYVCQAAEECTSAGGHARVANASGSSVDYESVAYCDEALLESACGPSALQPPADLAQCGNDLQTVTCIALAAPKTGLLLPGACRSK